MPRAELPRHVEILGQERRHDHAYAVVHESLGLQLPHARIDEGKSGPARAPRRERAVVGGPRRALGAEVGDRQLGPRREQLVEEVAPGELSHERAASGSVAQARRDLERREATEMEICGGVRGRVGLDRVVQLGVALEFPPGPRAESFERRAFPARDAAGGRIPGCELRGLR